MYLAYLFFFAALFCILFLLLWVQNLLLSFLIAFFLFFLFSPAADWLERRRISRTLSALIPLLGLIIISAGLGLIAAPTIQSQFSLLKSEWPKYSLSLANLLETIQIHVVSFHGPVDISEINEQLKEGLTSSVGSLFNNLPKVISSSVTILLLAPFLAFYMLLEGRSWVKEIKALAPEKLAASVDSLLEQISGQIGGFIRARVIETAVVILITWIGLLIVGSKYALILAIVYGVLNIIPYLGAFMGAAPALLIAFANNSESSIFMGLLAVFVIAQIIDNAVLVPFLVARIVNLHPLVVVIAILIGAQLMGILGMIISIPVASALKVMILEIYKHVYKFSEDIESA